MTCILSYQISAQEDALLWTLFAQLAANKKYSYHDPAQADNW